MGIVSSKTPNNSVSSSQANNSVSSSQANKSSTNTSVQSDVSSQANVSGQLNISSQVNKDDEMILIDYSIIHYDNKVNLYIIQRKSTGEKFVAKIIQFNNSFEFSQNRGEILQAFIGIDNPYVVKCFQLIFGFQKLGFILENSEGNSLYKLIKEKKNNGDKFVSEEICKVILDCGRGLKAIHDRKIIHRTVNPENIWIIKNNFKISDFFASIQLVETTEASTMIGTNGYIAPEIYRGEQYTNKVDVYSLGAVLYEMVMFQTPCTDIKFAFHDYEPVLVCPDHEPELLSLIKSMLSSNPLKRPTMDQILHSNFLIEFVLRKS